MGAYPFVAMFPVLAVTGERPDTILSCWGLLMLAVGLEMARTAASRGFNGPESPDMVTNGHIYPGGDQRIVGHSGRARPRPRAVKDTISP